MRPDHIYKIMRSAEWAAFQQSGVYTGSADDVRDGFIHLSTAHQMQGTLDKYYADAPEIIIAAVSAVSVIDDLKYETSRGGAEFPHLYADLMMDAVTQHWVLKKRAGEPYVLPKGFV